MQKAKRIHSPISYARPDEESLREARKEKEKEEALTI